MVEHQNLDLRVRGSSPLVPATLFNNKEENGKDNSPRL